MDINLKNKRILIIDDEQAMVDIVKALIKKHDGMPFGIASPEKGLQMAMGERYDAIVLDRHMPDMDGLEILKKIKANKRSANTPIVMLTGEKGSSEIQKSIKAGASGYVIKPFKPASFLEQLGKVLGLNPKKNQYVIDD